MKIVFVNISRGMYARMIRLQGSLNFPYIFVYKQKYMENRSDN